MNKRNALLIFLVVGAALVSASLVTDELYSNQVTGQAIDNSITGQQFAFTGDDGTKTTTDDRSFGGFNTGNTGNQLLNEQNTFFQNSPLTLNDITLVSYKDRYQNTLLLRGIFDPLAKRQELQDKGLSQESATALTTSTTGVSHNLGDVDGLDDLSGELLDHTNELGAAIEERLSTQVQEGVSGVDARVDDVLRRVTLLDGEGSAAESRLDRIEDDLGNKVSASGTVAKANRAGVCTIIAMKHRSEWHSQGDSRQVCAEATGFPNAKHVRLTGINLDLQGVGVSSSADSQLVLCCHDVSPNPATFVVGGRWSGHSDDEYGRRPDEGRAIFFSTDKPISRCEVKGRNSNTVRTWSTGVIGDPAWNPYSNGRYNYRTGYVNLYQMAVSTGSLDVQIRCQDADGLWNGWQNVGYPCKNWRCTKWATLCTLLNQQGYYGSYVYTVNDSPACQYSQFYSG